MLATSADRCSLCYYLDKLCVCLADSRNICIKLGTKHKNSVELFVCVFVLSFGFPVSTLTQLSPKTDLFPVSGTSAGLPIVTTCFDKYHKGRLN